MTNFSSRTKQGDSLLATRTGSLTIRSYCTCGGKLYVYAEPPEAAEEVHRLWRDIHSGEGHDGCDGATAARARRRQRG